MTAEFMLMTFILFAAGVISVPLASHLGLGSVLGYLIAGIAISPLLKWVGADIVSLQHFSEFGVVMMLFLVGLEMSPQSLWEMRHRIFLMGGLQVVVTTLIVALIGQAFGLSWFVSIAAGMVLALSSTAIVSQTLSEKGLMKSDGGQGSFSVLLFQDIAVIPMLIIIPLLAAPELIDIATQTAGAHDAHGGGHDDGHGAGLHLNMVENLPGWQAAIITFTSIALVVLMGRYLTDPIFNFVSRARLRELFVSTALMLVLGIALLMTMVGLSPALGTFLAGIVMAGSQYRHELESDISPFKGLFLGVFFITVGAGINFTLLSDQLALVLGLTFGLIVLKSLVLMVLGHFFKIEGSHRWLFALGLAQAGEFGFVLLSFTVSNHVIPTDIADILLLVVALSMLLTPALFILYDKVIERYYSKTMEGEGDEIENHGSIIIAGHGRFGGIVNRALRSAGLQTTVIDFSAEHLDMLRAFGLQVYYGDATRPDMLHAAGIDEAKVLIVAIDDKEAITHLTQYVCRTHPHVHVVARAKDRMHVYDLWSVGCRDIIRETYDSSVRAARSAFEALGLEREKAEGMLEVFHEMDQKSMLELADLYDIDIPVMENEPYMERARELVAEREEELTGMLNEQFELDEWLAKYEGRQ